MGSGTNIAPAVEIYVPRDYPTIQAAVNVPAHELVVWVMPGTYREQLVLPPDVSLRSVAGPELTVIDPDGGRAVYMNARSEISGFTITNSRELFYGTVEVFGSGSAIRGNIFRHNHRFNSGRGVIHAVNSVVVVVERNVFVSNGGSAHYGVVNLYGNLQGTSEIRNNLFLSNSCPAIVLSLSEGTFINVENNTIVGNTGGIRYSSYQGIGTYRNNLIFGNDIGVEEVTEGRYPPLLINNLVYGNRLNYFRGLDYTGTNGNISLPPLFYDFSSGDLRLTEQSPAVDAGNDGPHVDLLGFNRPVDGDGNGSATTDIGAYEYVRGLPRTPTAFSSRSLENAIELSWKDVPEADEYVLMRASARGGPYSELAVVREELFLDTNGVVGVTYHYTILARNIAGVGPISQVISDTPGNLPPVAVRDELPVKEDETAVLDPLANDSDPNGDPVRLVSVAAQGRASASSANGTLTFRGALNENGTNFVTYVITDGRNAFSTNVAVILIQPVNDLPSALPTSTNMVLNSSITLKLLSHDPDKEPLRFELLTFPTNGYITEFSTNSGTLRYYSIGRRTNTFTEEFTFRVHDPETNSWPTTARITVRLPADLDRDSLPDSWETRYGVQLPSADEDSDGHSNLEEYFAYTNPRDATSTLELIYIAPDPTTHALRLRWKAVAGVRYIVQHATSAEGPFQNIDGSLVGELFDAPGTEGIEQIVIPAGTFATGFYRVRVVP